MKHSLHIPIQSYKEFQKKDYDMDSSLVQELTDKIVRLQNLNLERHIRTLENTLGKCLSVDVIVLPYESYDVYEMTFKKGKQTLQIPKPTFKGKD